MYRRDPQWLGDFDPVNATRRLVGSDVIAGRILAQIPFRPSDRSSRLRVSISVGSERRYPTIVTRFGLEIVFSSKWRLCSPRNDSAYASCPSGAVAVLASVSARRLSSRVTCSVSALVESCT